MSRRALALLTILVVGIVLGILPWTVASDRVKAAIARQVREEYGVDLTVEGRATLALLPVPRVKLEGVTLSGGSGAFAAKASQLRAELRLLPLLAARLRLSELRISDADVRVALDAPESYRWAADGLQRRLAAGASGSARVERLVVTGSHLTLTRADGSAVRFGKVGALVRWPDPTSALDLTVTTEWQGEGLTLGITGLDPAQLIDGKADMIDLRFTSRVGSVTGSGLLTWTSAPRFLGTITARTPSLTTLTRWTGIGLDLQDLDRPVELLGDATVGPEGIEWPKAVLTLGTDRLDGSIAYRLDRARPQLRATLAGEDIDLSWVVPMADPAHVESPHVDYDVRLSAAVLRTGLVRLQDAAAGVLVNDQRLEMSLARATVAGGAVRGRVTASLEGEARDIRGQVGLINVDLERLLGETGIRRGFLGTVSGQATFEASGERQPDFGRQIRGRGTVTVRDGEFPGLSLGDAGRTRATVGTPPEWRGGKTRFGSATLALELANGLLDIHEGTMDTPTSQTSLKGRVSLVDGTLDLRTSTKAAGPSPTARPLALEVRGPIAKPNVTAEAVAQDAPVSRAP